MAGSKWTVAGQVRAIRKAAEKHPLFDRPPAARALIITHALNGDESFAPSMLTELWHRIVNEAADDLDRAALATVLSRLLNSPPAQKAICGVAGRAGQTRGHQGYVISQKVAERIRNGERAEDAWIEVGKEENLGSSAIQGHWTRWKPLLIATHKEWIRADVPPGTSEDELDAMARCIVLGKGAKARDSAMVAAVGRRAKAAGVNQPAMTIDRQSTDHDD